MYKTEVYVILRLIFIFKGLIYPIYVSTSNLLVISQNNNLHHRSMLATDAVIRNMV